MLRRLPTCLCSGVPASTQTPKPRLISFDLPVSIDSTRLSQRERERTQSSNFSFPRESKGGLKAVEPSLDEFFPSSLISPQPESVPIANPVKTPNLWIREGEKPSARDIGRFFRFSRDELMRLLPEGLSGELARDIFLMPSKTRDVGIMYRKITHELLSQLRLVDDGKAIQKRGWLLEGKRGVGKSSILNSIVAWARYQGNWIVLFEPFGSRFGKEITDINKSSSGLYIQNQLAKDLLQRFQAFNQSLLEQIPVNLDYYGRLGLDTSQIENIERVYLPLIEKAVEKKSLSLEDRVRELSRLRNSLKVPSMRQALKSPLNLAEIVEFGMNNISFATQAVGELLNQLKIQDSFPVLVALDEFNELFVVSEYVSARYDNTIFNGYIPSYHLSLPRILGRWDGHEFKRGLKLFATSWAKRNRRQFDPSILGINPEEIKQIRNFTKSEFEHYLAYQHLTGTSHRFPRSKLDYFYLLTQGNGFQSRRVISTLY